jgi:hypothetical protein
VLEDLVADEFGALANVLIELQAIDTEMFTLNDREWARTLLAYRGATHPLTLEQRTTLTSAGSTVVSATVDTNDWAALEQLVTAILDSVTFVDEETAPDE